MLVKLKVINFNEVGTGMKKRIEQYISLEILSGILLSLSFILALIISNSQWYDTYRVLLHLPISITVGEFSLNKPLIKWVNDGLMALFFLLLTLEAKYHCIEGEFKHFSNLILPIAAALGGVIIPVILYSLLTLHTPQYLKGWAVPMATDTAFVLGILAFLGRKLPLSARLFIVTLSIIDDIMAVLALAIFYTSSFLLTPFLIAFICLLILALIHSLRIGNLFPYALLGIILWISLVEAGIHGTIAGVLVGIFIPLHSSVDTPKPSSPLKNLESMLHPIVSLAILPVFAFLNSEVPFNQLNLQDFLSPITLAIIVSLFIGKQLGIMMFSFIAINLKLCKLPYQIS